jgi:hypothetical protein
MKLIKNPKCKNAAAKLFELNKEINLEKETIKVEYVANDKNGQLIIYGFDLPDDNITEENIVEFLFDEKSLKGDSSIMHKLFAFYDYGDNPVPFLVTKNKLYYLPSGIRQINFLYWKETENIEELVKIRNEVNLQLESEELDRSLFESEEQKEITIKELEKIYPKNQIEVLTKKPFWFEEIRYEQVPTKLENGRFQTKHTTNKITRMCILEKNYDDRIKVKVTYNHYIYYDGGGVDPQEATSYYETYYFLIYDRGRIEVDDSKQSKNEVYCKIRLEDQI